MSKRILIAAIVVLIVTGFVMDVCAQVTELKFTSLVADVSILGQAQKAWIEKCEKDAGGKLKIIPYWSGSLLKPREIFRGTLDGQSDLNYYLPILDLGLMSLNSVAWLPMMGWPSVWAQPKLYAQLLEKFPQLKAEYRGLMIYGLSAIPGTQISTVKKAVRVPADLKGLKITPGTEDLGRMIMAAGGAPVNLTIPDWYTSAEKGVTEGFINSLGAQMATKVIELLKVQTLAEPGGFTMNPHLLLINPENWKKIPPDIQKVIKDNEPFYIEQTTNAVIQEQKAALDYAAKNGHTIITLTPAEYKQWGGLVRPIHDEWIKKNAAKEAKAVYDTAKKMISEYKGK